MPSLRGYGVEIQQDADLAMAEAEISLKLGFVEGEYGFGSIGRPVFAHAAGVGAWKPALVRFPLWFVVYLIRTEIGMPRLVIRLSTAHPILASVF